MDQRPEMMDDSQTTLPALSPSVFEHEVHVWCASTDMPDHRVQSMQRVLATEEQTRADRFHFEKDRSRFIVARALLRVILGHYLACPPDELRFDYNPYGKPSLAPNFRNSTIQFNLSHSHALVLYAIAENRKVGIDVELIRPIDNLMGIAKSFFSPNETAELRSLSDEMKPRGFLNCWTRKEAYIKAKGRGLSIPLSQFDVSLLPDEEAALLRTEWNPEEARHWAIRDLPFVPGYAAALVAEGHDWELKHAWWPTVGRPAMFT